MCYNPNGGEIDKMARPKTGFNKQTYDTNYHRGRTQYVSIGFRKDETEILEKLASVPSKTDYIRQLILADIQKEKETNQ